MEKCCVMRKRAIQIWYDPYEDRLHLFCLDFSIWFVQCQYLQIFHEDLCNDWVVSKHPHITLGTHAEYICDLGFPTDTLKEDVVRNFTSRSLNTVINISESDFPQSALERPKKRGIYQRLISWSKRVSSTWR